MICKIAARMWIVRRPSCLRVYVVFFVPHVAARIMPRSGHARFQIHSNSSFTYPAFSAVLFDVLTEVKNKSRDIKYWWCQSFSFLLLTFFCIMVPWAVQSLKLAMSESNTREINHFWIWRKDKRYMYHTHWIVPVGRNNYHITLFDPVYFKYLKPKCTRVLRLSNISQTYEKLCNKVHNLTL